MPIEHKKAECTLSCLHIGCTDKGDAKMEAVIVYLWVEAWEIGKALDPEFWDQEEPAPAPMHVSLKSPEDLDSDAYGFHNMNGESHNFRLVKRKIYLLPPSLRLHIGDREIYEIYYEGEKCELRWDPTQNTVTAKNQYGAFLLLPSD